MTEWTGVSQYHSPRRQFVSTSLYPVTFLSFKGRLEGFNPSHEIHEPEFIHLSGRTVILMI